MEHRTNTSRATVLTEIVLLLSYFFLLHMFVCVVLFFFCCFLKPIETGLCRWMDSTSTVFISYFFFSYNSTNQPVIVNTMQTWSRVFLPDKMGHTANRTRAICLRINNYSKNIRASGWHYTWVSLCFLLFYFLAICRCRFIYYASLFQCRLPYLSSPIPSSWWGVAG